MDQKLSLHMDDNVQYTSAEILVRNKILNSIFTYFNLLLREWVILVGLFNFKQNTHF
jgi:predicted 2-oxoglutarate/Fe(II)-dependent dioxygenase YbiX